MCFSAEASFGAAAVVTTIGVISYKKAGKTPYRLLAMIPILFGIQQFVEGIVWTASMYTEFDWLLDISTSCFIFFAWIIWPFYIPFTMWKLEQNPTRKKILQFLLFIGIFISFTLTYVLLFNEVHAEIVDCSIRYNFGSIPSYLWILTTLYLLTTVLSTFILDIPYMKFLGVLNLMTFFISKFYYHDTAISVWCFLAAISSMLILWIISHAKKNSRHLL